MAQYRWGAEYFPKRLIDDFCDDSFEDRRTGSPQPLVSPLNIRVFAQKSIEIVKSQNVAGTK